MFISCVLAICSFFSFPPEVGGLVGEELFSSVNAEALQADLIFHLRYELHSQKEDRIQYWRGLIFQKMMQQNVDELNHVWLLSPPSQSMLTLGCIRSEAAQAKAEISLAVQKLKTQGFSVKALEEVKKEAKQALNQVPEGYSPQSQAQLIDAVTLSDLSAFLKTLSFDFSHPLKEEITYKTAVSNPESFLELPLNEPEKKIIHKIISTIAEKNPIKLAFEKRSLDKKGKKIHHVHPLRFLGYIFSDPFLKKCMKEIKKSHFKWEGFMDGLSKKMREESHDHNILPYAEGFADYVNADRDHVVRYLEHHDWEGLVRYLL